MRWFLIMEDDERMSSTITTSIGISSLTHSQPVTSIIDDRNDRRHKPQITVRRKLATEALLVVESRTPVAIRYPDASFSTFERCFRTRLESVTLGSRVTSLAMIVTNIT